MTLFIHVGGLVAGGLRLIFIFDIRRWSYVLKQCKWTVCCPNILWITAFLSHCRQCIPSIFTAFQFREFTTYRYWIATCLYSQDNTSYSWFYVQYLTGIICGIWCSREDHLKVTKIWLKVYNYANLIHLHNWPVHRHLCPHVWSFRPPPRQTASPPS